MLHFTGRARARNRFASLAAAAFLAGCAGQNGNLGPPQAAAAPADVSVAFQLPDASPAPCKGQKNTKTYASLASQSIKSKGGTVCVPAFGGWGGALQYPASNQNTTVALTSSTTAYKGGNFPGVGSQKPIFYLQFGFGGIMTFSNPLPKGSSIVSTHVVANKTYSLELFQYYPGIGWSSVMSSCYSVAKKVTVGGGIPNAGGVLLNQSFRGTSGIIEVFNGKLSTNKC